MIDFFKKYKAFGIGVLITIALRIILGHIGFLRINNELVLENIAYFVFWSFVFGLPIYKFSYLKEHRIVVLKLVGVIAFLLVAIISDSILKIPDNPLTILFLAGFWISLVALVSPQFFNRYKYYLIGVYGLLLAYFSYVRLSAVNFDAYAANSKEVALMSLVVPIPIFGFIWGYEQWKWVKSLQSQKTKAELSMLKAQINPHFFFNTLNNLYSLTVRNSKQAPDVILKLSEMMRYTIYEGEKEKVSLEDEIAYLNNYIDLHKIRYKKEVSIQFTQDLDREYAIAPLLFITLLENALKHGVESMTDKAYINMHLEGKEGVVSFLIENNFDPSEVSEEKGIGLENLKRRLNLTYPKNHEFNISEKDGIFKADLRVNTL